MQGHGGEGLQFGGLRIASLLFADDVVLMAPSACDLQHSLDRFAAECEAAGMRISTSKSEAMVLSRKPMDCLLHVGKFLPQVTEFKYLGILFSSEGTREREMGQRIGAVGTVLHSLNHTVVMKREGKAFNLPVNLRSYPHLWSWRVGHDLKNEIADTSGRNGFSQKGGQCLP